MKRSNINRSDLVLQLAYQYKMDPTETEGVIKAILGILSKSLIEKKRIEIRGFGSFDLRHRNPRKARNPKTGEIVITEPKNSVHFKPGKELRERINKGRLLS